MPISKKRWKYIPVLSTKVLNAALGPVIKKTNKRNSNATTIFKRLKKRTPFFKPVITDTVAIIVITAIITICVVIPELTPVKKFSPEAICRAPNPKEVANPKSVATTAITSIISPYMELIFLPIKGKNTERKESGRCLLNVK